MIFSEWLADVYEHMSIDELIYELTEDGYSEEECEEYINGYVREYKEYCYINDIKEEYDI